MTTTPVPATEQEGIPPALEPAHALARLGELARDVGKGGTVLFLLSGRGDKDLEIVARARGIEL